MLMVAGYRGIGWVSDLIKLLTYSKYSHLGVLFTEDMNVQVNGRWHFIAAGCVIEAWKGGVKISDSLGANHTHGTPVDLFAFKTPLTPEQEQRMAAFLISQKGKGYDYWNVGRFVPIVRLLFPKPEPNIYLRNHVFCSELVMESSIEIKTPLLERCKAWEVPPRDPPRSPLLRFVKSVVTSCDLASDFWQVSKVS